MSAARILALQLSWLDVDRQALRGDTVMLAFINILNRGYRGWEGVREALDGEADLERAFTLAVDAFSLNPNNPQDHDFDQAIRMAADAQSFGSAIDVDFFALAVAPVRRELYRLAAPLADGVTTARSLDHARARAQARSASAHARSIGARTGWGRDRAQRRAHGYDIRAHDLARRRDDIVRDVRAKAPAVIREGRDTLAVLAQWTAS